MSKSIYSWLELSARKQVREQLVSSFSFLWTLESRSPRGPDQNLLQKVHFGSSGWTLIRSAWGRIMWSRTIHYRHTRCWARISRSTVADRVQLWVNTELDHVQPCRSCQIWSVDQYYFGSDRYRLLVQREYVCEKSLWNCKKMCV